MYSLLLALIYLAFISLGLHAHIRIHFPRSDYFAGAYMGVVSMVISGGTIASSLLSDKLTRKLGTGGVTAASVLLTVLGLFGFSVSAKFWMLLAFAVPYGLGAGAIDAALNNYVALHYKARYMSWLHCFWGVGTIVSPFVMSWALTHRTWNDGYRAVALMQLCIAALLLVTLPVRSIMPVPAQSPKRFLQKERACRIFSRAFSATAPRKPRRCSGQARILSRSRGFPRRTPRGWLRSFISASPRGGS